MTWEPMSDWVEPDERYNVLLYMDAAYREVLDEKWHRLGMWTWTMEYVEEVLAKAFKSNGFETAPLYWDAFMQRVCPPAPLADRAEHMRLVRACMTDYTTQVQAQIRYREADEANNHFEFTGKTGTRKSTSAIAVADWASPIDPARISEYVNLDFAQIATRLRSKKRGEWVIQDELLETAGEGSRTLQLRVQNILDTLRKSGVSLAMCSPDSRQMATVQAGFESLAWNKQRHQTIQLVWVDGLPHGVTRIPWCRKELYDAYVPWKDGNVDRTLSGHFKDNAFMARSAVRLFQDEHLVEFLRGIRDRPAKKDLRAAVRLFSAEMISGEQEEGLVDFVHTILEGYDRIGPNYQKWWGLQPPLSMKAVAELFQ